MENVTSESPAKVAILVYDGVEALDFVGPLEVFSVVGKSEKKTYFEPFIVAQESPVRTQNGMSVNPSYGLADCPRADVVVVPGGLGSRREMQNPVVLDWVRAQAASARLTLSVCTGALILAKAGVLAGLKATTHFAALPLLRELMAETGGGEVVEGVKYVDNGRVILSAGISAGIDMSLHAVSRLCGTGQAVAAARHMEYDWKPAEA